MSLFDDNATLDAATLLAAFDGPRLTANDLAVTAFRRKALLRTHLPDLYPTSLFPTGYYAGKENNIAYEDYYNAFGPAGSLWIDYATGAGTPVNAQLMGTTGANAPYGPNAAADSGWRILAVGSVVADAAEVSYSVAADDLTSNGLHGIIVTLGVEIGAPNITGGVVNQDCVWTAIGFRDGGGSLRVIERSITAHAVRAVCVGGVKTGTVILQSDLDDLGDGDMTDIFGLYCTGEVVGGAGSPTNQHTSRVGSYHISCLPVRAGGF